MKRLIFLLIICLVLLPSIVLADSPLIDSSLIPIVKIGDSHLKVYGFTHLLYNDNIDDFDVDKLRIRFQLETPTSFGMFSEVELAKVNEPNNNWLREFWLSYKRNSTIFRIGRLFVAAGRATPPPFLLKTVNSYSYPFSSYAYGVQVDTNYKKWSLIGDITGSSGKVFNESGNWESIEISARAKGQITNNLIGSFTIQAGKRFQRISADIEYEINALTFLGGLYIANEDKGDKDKEGGFLLTDYKINKYLSLHTQIDHGTVWANGLQVFAGENISLTLDYESVVEGDSDDDFFVRLQFRF